ncbi:MAG: DNA-binding transcriptional regulator Fis [Thiohalobacteraceae bacterium]|nr:DNA-binding transcriptional regulator Fis [Gammaproteobacteria bacterium]
MSTPVEKATAVHPLPRREPQRLREAVRECLESYFADLDGHKAADIYQLVLGEVEPAMLQTILGFAQGNQTRAAEILGINRATLRKKLRQYGLEP